MTTPIAPWIMAAATRLVDEWSELEQEAARVAQIEHSASAGRQYLIGAVAHVVWTAKQKEAPR